MSIAHALQGTPSAPTGYTTVTFTQMSNDGDTASYGNMAEVDSRKRETVTLKAVPTRKNKGAPGGYTNEVFNYTYRLPITLSTGEIVDGVVARVSLSKHPESTTANRNRALDALHDLRGNTNLNAAVLAGQVAL